MYIYIFWTVYIHVYFHAQKTNIYTLLFTYLFLFFVSEVLSLENESIRYQRL